METLKRKDINEILRIIGDSGQPINLRMEGICIIDSVEQVFDDISEVKRNIHEFIVNILINDNELLESLVNKQSILGSDFLNSVINNAYIRQSIGNYMDQLFNSWDMSLEDRFATVYNVERLVEELRQYAIPDVWKAIEEKAQSYLTILLDKDDELWNSLIDITFAVSVLNDNDAPDDHLVIKAARRTERARLGRRVLER